MTRDRQVAEIEVVFTFQSFDHFLVVSHYSTVLWYISFYLNLKFFAHFQFHSLMKIMLTSFFWERCKTYILIIICLWDLWLRKSCSPLRIRANLYHKIVPKKKKERKKITQSSLTSNNNLKMWMIIKKGAVHHWSHTGEIFYCLHIKHYKQFKHTYV